MKLKDNLYFYPERGMMDCNTYVIKDNLTVLIDPGFTPFLVSRIKDLRRDGIKPEEISTILNTHLHGDHCGANEALKEISGAKIVSHPLQKQFYQSSVTETSALFGFRDTGFKADSYIDNNRLKIGKIELEFIPSPGHSPDSVCIYCRQEKFLICGDVIFDENTGRVDLPGGSADELKHSIEELAKLDIEYLLPGHMDIIIGADKIKSNFDYVRQNIFVWL